ncbi:hypothetical protein GCM10009551_053840 [Nocardiopsis tropica]|uniref:hypothetical protein n=1 Tax=Tsukamurella strandjordii TaxID=147577 RepID=UPI0031CDBF20
MEFAEETWYRIVCDRCGTRGPAGLTEGEAQEIAFNLDDGWIAPPDAVEVLCPACQLDAAV